jgi:hypothetical protein
MTTLLQPPPTAAPFSPDPRALRRFSVAEYDRMVEAGILTKNDRVELLEGWIVTKMPQNPRRRTSVDRLILALTRVLPSDWTLCCQAPIALSDSEPEPDVTIARGAIGTYDSRHPGPADIGLPVESGDSSVSDDRRYKTALYAREKIPQFWLVDLAARRVDVATNPQSDRYQKIVAYSEAEAVPLVLDGQRIADIPVKALLPQP